MFWKKKKPLGEASKESYQVSVKLRNGDDLYHEGYIRETDKSLLILNENGWMVIRKESVEYVVVNKAP